MIDLTTILVNLSHSLAPVQRLLSGFAYLLGLVSVIMGLIKIKEAAKKGQQASFSYYTPIAYIAGGAILLYLPSSTQIFANTFFGATNILSYTTQIPDPLYSSLLILIETAGVIWFVRGVALLIHSSEPGKQHGPKGLAFAVAGILAMNIDNTLASLTKGMEWLIAVIK